MSKLVCLTKTIIPVYATFDRWFAHEPPPPATARAQGLVKKSIFDIVNTDFPSHATKRLERKSVVSGRESLMKEYIMDLHHSIKDLYKEKDC